MTAQRRKEISNAIMSQEQKRIRAENETRILLPILKKIEAILATQDFKKLAKLRDALEAKIKADQPKSGRRQRADPVVGLSELAKTTAWSARTSRAK